MRVLILSQYYYPEPIPKPAELAQGLMEHGHIPEVITGFPDYPSGELYAGYSLRLFQRDVISGVTVNRTFEYPHHGKSAAGRFINYLSFMLSAPFATFLVRKVSVIYVWHPPLTVGIAAWVISRLLNVPVVYDVQDIWPETINASGMLSDNTRIYHLLQRLEKFVYRRMHFLIVVTEGAKRNLVSKGVPEEKVSVLPHWVDETQFHCISEQEQDGIRNEFHWSNRFVVLFAGNIGFVQGLDNVIRAGALLPLDSSIIISFMGDGAAVADLRQLTRELNVEDRIQFISHQPAARMPAIMSTADVLLVHLRKSVITDFVVPSKTLSYLAAGRPILMAMGGAGNDLINDSGAGVTIEPDDAQILANTIRLLADMEPEERGKMGENGRYYIRERLGKADIVGRYVKLLERAAKQGR